MYFDGKLEGNVCVTIEDSKGNVRKIEHVTKIDQDVFDDRLSVHSTDDDVDICSVKFSKVKKIIIEVI